MQTRSFNSNFETREDGEELFIEGYFAVFDSEYFIWDGNSESVKRGAFSKTLGNDIRALINHETRLVLGRNKAGTLELREDEHGLWGRIKVNPKDRDAMNLYERVKRGDVSQCSFGFEIVKENTEFRDDGTVHWTLEEVNLFEVSVVTFPAYESTAVEARKKDYAEIEKKRLEAWREKQRKRIRGEKYGVKSFDAEEGA